MATTPQTVYEPHAGAPSDLQEKARRHLWMHFTRMGSYDQAHEIPIIVRGEGSYVYDEHDKRYLDGLSALFCVNAGHGRAELGEAAAEQAKQLGFYTNWSYAHPKAIELAERIANLAPGDLNRVFFTSGGSEAVEVALVVLVVDVRALAAHDDRNLMLVVVRAHPGEVHPEMATCLLLERACGPRMGLVDRLGCGCHCFSSEIDDV